MNNTTNKQTNKQTNNKMTDVNIHFSREEYAERQDRVRRSIEQQCLDGILLFKIEDQYWLTGYDSDGFSIFGCMFIGTDGQLTHLARPADLEVDQQTYDALHRDASAVAPVQVVPWPDRGTHAVGMAAHNMLATGLGSGSDCTSSGPSPPWNSSAPRSLRSDFLKSGSTSSKPQPVLPAWRQAS